MNLNRFLGSISTRKPSLGPSSTRFKKWKRRPNTKLRFSITPVLGSVASDSGRKLYASRPQSVSFRRGKRARQNGLCEMTAASHILDRKDRKMPRYRSIKQMQSDLTVIPTRLTVVLPKSGRKVPGTRLGILQDWREGSSKSGKSSVGVGKAFRDGR